MTDSYRPKTVTTDDLQETLNIIEGMIEQYARDREEAKQKYDEFMAWKKESPQQVAEWRKERKRVIEELGRLFADDDPVEVYKPYLQNRRDETYAADAERLRSIIALVHGDEAAVSDEIYEIVSTYNRFVRPQRFWEKDKFKGLPGLILIVAAIYYFGASGVGWFFIGISALFSLFFFGALAKGGGRVNGIMLLPAIILFLIGVFMVGTDTVMGLLK